MEPAPHPEPQAGEGQPQKRAGSFWGRPPAQSVVDEDKLIERLKQATAGRSPQTEVFDVTCYASLDKQHLPDLAGLCRMAPWPLLFLPRWPQ